MFDFNNFVMKSIIEKPLPLPLVYVSNGVVELHDYVNLPRKNEIWGIFSGDLYYNLVIDKSVTWSQETSKSRAYTIGGKSLALPTLQQLSAAFIQKEMFNRTVEILCYLGLKADKWSDDLFCALDVDFEEEIVGAFNMQKGCAEKVHFSNSELCARLALSP